MKFDLKRPCKDCPFRTDVTPYLTAARVRDITNGLIRQQGTFSCHKTNDFDDEDGEAVETPNTQHCAGATIMLERLGRPNQLMRIAERFGAYDRTKLDMDSPVYRTPVEMAAAQTRSRRSRPQSLSDGSHVEPSTAGYVPTNNSTPPEQTPPLPLTPMTIEADL